MVMDIRDRFSEESLQTIKKYLEEHNLPTNVYEGALMAEQYYNNQAEMQAQDAMEAQMTEAEYEELMRAIGN